MKKRTVSTSTVLEPYGLVRISGEVSRNPFYTWEERQFEPEFEVYDLRASLSNGQTLHTPFNCGFEQWEVEKCEEALIEKFLEDEGFEQDARIDEMIESGRQYAHRAYA